jgi:Limiting CO2-inducible proteins B/C beta carbonyic anhydrases
VPTRTLSRQIRDEFPGAVPASDFVATWRDRCLAAGFDADTALLAVGTCRDEVCFPFVAQLEAVWGPAFQLGSLGGLLTIGRTGIGGVASHAPREPGEPVRYVLVAAAHIGVDESGTFGYLRREHQEVSSRTCGALMAFRDELLTSRLRLGYDPVDPEMSLLRERILTALVYGDIPEPVELTQVVARVIDEDLRDLLRWIEQEAVAERDVQTAVVTGVLIHTATGDWFQAQGPRIHSTLTGERVLAL